MNRGDKKLARGRKHVKTLRRIVEHPIGINTEVVITHKKRKVAEVLNETRDFYLFFARKLQANVLHDTWSFI